MMPFPWFVLLLLTFVVSALAVWLLSGPLAGLAMDEPNHRSLHVRPIPRTGGLGIVTAVALAWLVARPGLPLALWGGALALVLVSFADDRLDLPAALRFAAHLAVAGWLALQLGLSGWWLVAAALATGWMTNLYNFMDGADGLAGSMTASGFAAYALALWLHGDNGLAEGAAVVAVAACGFLLFNFPPARVFMGDAGSVPIGFLAAGFGLTGMVHAAWPVWFPCMVFAPFIADASVTLVRRALRGERVWQAHREHYYQRLIRMGFSHRQMAAIALNWMISAAAVALFVLRTPGTGWLAALWAAGFVSGMLVVDRRWQAFSRRN